MLTWQLTVHTLLLTLSSVVSAGLGLAAWRRRPAPGTVPFALLCLSLVIWSSAYSLEISATTLDLTLFWAQVRWIAIPLTTPFWALFALSYSRSRSRLPLATPLLFIIPTLTIALMWSNRFHNLMWEPMALEQVGPISVLAGGVGPWFWLHTLYSYSLAALGTFWLVRFLIGSPQRHTGHVAMVIVGIFVPWVVNVAYVLPGSPLGLVDPTPMIFPWIMLAVGWSIFRFRLLDLAPIAHQNLFLNIGDPVLVFDAEGRLSAYNPPAERLFERPLEEMLGLSAAALFTGWDSLLRYATLIGGTGAHSALPVTRGRTAHDLSIRPLHDGLGYRTGSLVVLHDVTEHRRAARRLEQLTEQLAHQAYHDSLTGLPNRMLFEDRLHLALAQAERRGNHVAICYIDVDRFKLVNDTYGHATGDLLLKLIAERLDGRLRDSDTLGRMGGDEFALILGDLSDPLHVGQIAQKLLDLFEEPFLFQGNAIVTSISLGIALFPSDSRDPQQLLNYADSALYQAKRQGKNCFVLFRPSLQAATHQRLALEQQLRGALERDELLLHYQPQVALGQGRVVVVEALARWQHPRLGWVPPATFIPIAEESGQIAALGRWVLEEACRQNKAWQRAGYPPVRVGVNISAAQFAQPDFVTQVRETLERSELEPRWLELELTESLLMHQLPDAAAKFAALRALGIAIAIDDFGSGYASLRYLQQLEVDTLKLDQSFVRHLTEPTRIGSNATAIIAAVTVLARNLRMNVVIEGVESERELAILQHTHFDRVQGFLFFPPLAPEQIPSVLDSAMLVKS